MPVEYSWTASNGNKFTNVIEVLEDHTYADDLDMDNIGNTAKGNYTWKNEWYVNRDGSGTKIDYGVDKPNGTDMTIYGKWVSIVIFNLANSYNMANYYGWRPQAPVEIIKGQRCNGRDAYPESGDDWDTWWDSYTRYGFAFTGSGNRIMSWNGSFVPTGNINLYPGP